MKLKKLYSFLTLLTASLLAGTGTMWGASPLTVANGSATSSNVPVWGLWADAASRVQMIYPASLLTEMQNKNITSVTFYLSSTASSAWTSTFTVGLAEVDASSIADDGAYYKTYYYNSAATTTVYSGSLSGTSSTMVVTFADPFYYEGGNLLINVSYNAGDDYSASFYGENQSATASIYGHAGETATSSGSGSTFLPKTSFAYADATPITCPKPASLAASASSATSASVSWKKKGTESAWDLQYSNNNGETWTTLHLNTSNVTVDENDCSYSLTGLTAQTTYYVQVQAVCGVGDESGYPTSAVSFTTPCAQKSIPYTCGFEAADGCTSTGSGTLPPCWDEDAYSYYGTLYPYVYNSSAKTGSNCLYFYGGTSTSQAYAILPEFEGDLKDLTLSFYYKHSSTSASYPQFTVGYYDPENPSTFVPLGDPLARPNTSYNLCKKNLEDVPTTVKNIVIRWAGGSSMYSGYIDDVRVYRTPNCAEPTGLSYSAPTAHGATFSWTNGGSETAWKIEYSTTADFSSDVHETAANSNPFTLSPGMDANTVYYVRVYAACGGVDDWSDYSEAINFRTDCGAIEHASLPWSYGFEDVTTGSGVYNIPLCWQRNPDDNNIYVQTSDKRTGSKALKIYGGGSSNRIIRFPAFADDFSTLTLEFYYKATSGSNYGTPKVGYVNTGGTFVSLKTLDQAGSYTKAELTYPSSYEDTPAYIAIQYSGGSYDFGSLFIDDITVKETPACATPTGLSKSAQTNNSATLSWTKNGSETSWNVQYSTTSDFSSDNHVAVANTNSSYVLSGLDANTHYYVHVQAACEGEYSDAIDFTTDCDAISSASTWTDGGFEDGTLNAVPSCWLAKTSNEGNSYKPAMYVNNSSSYVRSGSKSLLMKAYNDSGEGYAIFPVISDASITSLQLKFWHKKEVAAFILKVGYLTNINNLASFVSLQTCADATDWTEETVDLSTLPDGARLAFYYFGTSGTSKYSVGVDDITFAAPPTCFKPATLNDAASITPEGATFTWTASSSNNEDYYQYICVAGGTNPNDIDWSSSTKVAKAVAPATNQAVITGKAAGTYDFYVRSWCSNDDQSEAVKKSFTTATVTAPTIGAITATNEAAHATWTAPDVSFSVQYQWKTSKEGSDWSAATSNLYADISDLDASTTYTFYVRSYYDASHIGSEDTKSFTTECDPFTVAVGTPFVQNFDDLSAAGQIPDCWDNSEVTLPNPYASTPTAARKWSYYATGYSGGHCVRYDSYNVSSGVINVFTSPIIVLNADADLTFYAKNPKGGDYKVQISVNGGDRADLITGLTNLSSWTKKEAPLTYSAGTRIQLFFVGTSNNAGGDAYLYLDEVEINPVSCRKPASDPVASAISDTEATLTWTAGGTNTDYQFALALKDEAPVWKAANVVSALTKSFDDLTPLTNYDFYVRTYCDALNQSEARKVSFRTECADFVTMPFEENFNSVAADAIPDCWDNSEGTSTDYYKWKGVTLSGHNGTNCVRFNSSTNDADATNILATPTIQLNEGNLLSFYAKNPTGGAFKVQIKEEGEDAVDLLATGLTGLADWTLKYVDIPAAYNNKKVQILFHATSNEGDENAYIYIDDVRVLKHLTLSDAANNTTVLNNNNGKKVAVTIGRTIVRKGYYNTICLPFDVPTLTGTPFGIDGVELWAFKYAKVDEATDELLFRIDRSDHIEAGVPYFIGFPNDEDDIVNPFFNNVTISATVGQNIGDANVAQLCGIVDQPVEFKAGDQTKLFLAANNTLYWWNGASDSQMNAFRAYFKVKTSGSYMPIRRGMRARIVKEEQVATGVENVQGNNVQSTKLLENNQVIIIRNGVKYNLQGQVIK